MNGTRINPFSHWQGVLLAERTPIVGIAEFQNGNQIQKVGRGFSKLDGLMAVTGFDHGLALLQPEVRGMTCGGVIPGEFWRKIRVAALLEQFNHLADETFSF
ncbi:MAG: hypothetical protein WBN75_10725 [Verrucomicrobiia bacterium]